MSLRRLSLAVASAVFSFTAHAATVHPELPEVRRVYLLSMSGGLDQYLADRLTKSGRFEVVVDPEKADAVFTDRLGTAFEERWAELYPPPPPPEPVKPKEDETKKSDAAALEATTAPFVRMSSFARGRGNVFLVSRKSGTVVWSHYRPSKDSRSRSLHNTADDIVDRLTDDLKPKK